MSSINFKFIETELVAGKKLEDAVKECIALACSSGKRVRLHGVENMFTIDIDLLVNEVLKNGI